MQNPIPKNDMWTTPESVDTLMARCENFHGNDRTVAYTIAMMTLNLCHKLVEQAREESKGAW